MRKNNIFTVILFASTIFLFSCSNFLDVKPIGKLIPDEVEEFENVLNNVSTINYHFIDNNNGDFYSMLGDNVSISENQALYFYTRTSANVDRIAAYTFNTPYQDPKNPQYTWEWGIYRAVGLFNTVIEGIENLEASKRDSENGQYVIAEAKAGRAWSYLVGTLGYGPMYVPGAANDTRVLPYRTSADPYEPNPDLSTTEELFELILDDLDDALGAPDKVVNPTRANKTAVYALRANYFMYKRDWDKMLENAEEAWKLAIQINGSADNMIYDLNQFEYIPNSSVSPPAGTDAEVSLILKGPDNLVQQTYNREILFFRYGPVGTTPYPSQEYLDLFDPATDRRYQLFALKTLGYSVTVGGVLHDDGVRTKFFRDNKTVRQAGITYPELLLVKAEANARKGNLTTALDDLNTLRKYRYTGADTNLPGGASLSQDGLLEEILLERRRELPFYSFQRVFDLKRFVLDEGKPWSKQSVTHEIGSSVITGPINNEYFTLPLSNPIIKYNPSWGLTPNNEEYDPTWKN